MSLGVARTPSSWSIPTVVRVGSQPGVVAAEDADVEDVGPSRKMTVVVSSSETIDTERIITPPLPPHDQSLTMQNPIVRRLPPSRLAPKLSDP